MTYLLLSYHTFLYQAAPPPSLQQNSYTSPTPPTKLSALHIVRFLLNGNSIFILKPTSPHEVLDELEAHARQGDVFFVYYEREVPCAYMIVGNSTIEAEGFLLQNTNTAQIKSAYARQDIRRKGIGRALLQRAIEWSQAHGYERIFVEHETANFYGGTFWHQHFNPYIYFSMRYIDNTI